MTTAVKLVLGVLVIVVIVGGVLLATGKKAGNETSNNDSHMNMQPNTNTADTAKPVQTNTVAIDNFAFSPSTITVRKGTKVTWTNQDSTAHTVTATDANGPKSGTLNNGDSYSYTFDAVGTFEYHCNFHPDMTGTVTITE